MLRVKTHSDQTGQILRLIQAFPGLKLDLPYSGSLMYVHPRHASVSLFVKSLLDASEEQIKCVFDDI